MPLIFYLTMANVRHVGSNIVLATNDYATRLVQGNDVKIKSQMKHWVETNSVEIKQMFSIIITMGMNSVPKIAQYRSRNKKFNNQFIAELMPRDRFLILLRCIHFYTKNHEGRLGKISTALDAIKRISKICITRKRYCD